VQIPSGMLCTAIANAMVRETVKPLTAPIEIASPSGKLCRKMPAIRNTDVFFRLQPCSCLHNAGCMCGIILSTAYIAIVPIMIPNGEYASMTDESMMLSGISSRNDIASMTPAAKASILYMKKSDGFFNTPIREPIIGPAIVIRSIMLICSIYTLWYQSTINLSVKS